MQHMKQQAALLLIWSFWSNSYQIMGERENTKRLSNSIVCISSIREYGMPMEGSLSISFSLYCILSAPPHCLFTVHKLLLLGATWCKKEREAKIDAQLYRLLPLYSQRTLNRKKQHGSEFWRDCSSSWRRSVEWWWIAGRNPPPSWSCIGFWKSSWNPWFE